MASFLSIRPSPFPPFCALSYSARARNPLRKIWGRRWLRREIAEQFIAVINRAVTVPVKHKEGLIRSRRGPCYPLAYSIVIQIKIDAKGCIGEIKTVSRYVNDDRTAATATGTCIKTDALTGSFIPAKYQVLHAVFVFTKVLATRPSIPTTVIQRVVHASARFLTVGLARRTCRLFCRALASPRFWIIHFGRHAGWRITRPCR
jgi:hypothetical protein